ncbi:MAG: hypothetical protein U0Z75_04155 [Deinococcaceae bacterium]
MSSFSVGSFSPGSFGHSHSPGSFSHSHSHRRHHGGHRHRRLGFGCVVFILTLAVGVSGLTWWVMG